MPEEIYVSTDIEADGPIPGPHSMLSFASVAMRSDKTIVDEFTANLLPLPNASPHPRTMLWWESYPDALRQAQEDQQDPAEVMPRYVKWLRKLPGRVVMVGQPAAYDFMWIYWYLQSYCNESPFGHSALDAKTYAMALLKRPYRDCVKNALPKEWHDDLPHTHVAIDDAREQGAMFINMLRANGVVS